VPTVLEVPTKDHPYDPNTDSVMQRVKVFMGGKVEF
jgi:V-type H+-transporting ATPase subunit F